MALATSLKKVTSKLVNKFGGTITYRQITGSAYNTSTGSIVETATDSTIKAVIVTGLPGNATDVVRKDETSELVQEQQKKIVIAAQDLLITPNLADKIVISGVVHQIEKINVIEQANTPIAIELYLRA